MPQLGWKRQTALSSALHLTETWENVPVHVTSYHAFNQSLTIFKIFARIEKTMKSKKKKKYIHVALGAPPCLQGGFGWAMCAMLISLRSKLGQKIIQRERTDGWTDEG